MRTSYRRGLSTLAALALVLGSALVAAPAHADPADPPVVDITSLSDGSSVAGFTLEATITDDDLDYWTVIAQGPEFHSLHTEANPLVTPLPSPANVNLTFDTSGWLNGSYQIIVNAVDQAVHISTDSVEVIVTNGHPSSWVDSPR